ncbi:MAG: fliJ, partial [Solirubrobacterales bacterium]|nr:fliJ [Solirubrobacterales bacterium]
MRFLPNTRPSGVHQLTSRTITKGVSESPFRFGLERVRQVRAHDERTAQEGFAGSLTARSREQAALVDAQSTLELARRTATPAAAQTGTLSGPGLVAGAAWVQRL